MLQHTFILLLFIAALCYLGYILYKTFTAKENECGGSCGCSKIDISKIEKEILKSKKIEN